MRAGTVSAYGTLYERHCEAARNLTCQLAKSDAEADDLVSEAFARVFNALCTGKGPGSAFRAYLLTTLWHVAHDVTEDLSEPIGKDAAALAVPFADTAVGARREGVRLAARTLAGSAVAHRDRTAEPGRGRAAARTDPQRCPGARLPRPRGAPAGLSAGPFVGEPSGRLPGDGLPQRERVRVENHLDGCESCRALASELVDINGGLRMIIAPIVLGGAAPGYLATVSTEKAAAAAAGKASARQPVAVAVSGTRLHRGARRWGSHHGACRGRYAAASGCLLADRHRISCPRSETSSTTSPSPGSAARQGPNLLIQPRAHGIGSSARLRYRLFCRW
ncbi:sigma factor [Amycolatopsis echigonensis]|uniref:sigma factor n=1 Tax=Amycolatopsis echigonensis TaxID=2576905 RepID=UPI003A5217E5